MLDLIAPDWASGAWDLVGPALPRFCAILALSFAARIAWSVGIISFAPIAIAAMEPRSGRFRHRRIAV